MKPEEFQSGQNKFPAKEKLKSRKSIQSLFEERKSFTTPSIRVIYKIIHDASVSLPLFAVSVPKKYFKKAVTRNLIKRQIREAYRLNKYAIQRACEVKQITLEMMWIWTKKEDQEYIEIENQVNLLLNKLLQFLNNTPSKS